MGDDPWTLWFTGITVVGPNGVGEEHARMSAAITPSLVRRQIRATAATGPSLRTRVREGDRGATSGRMTEVVVVDYDEEWPQSFEAIEAVVWPAVQDVALRIEHVGSTSVPGLAAKPVIDVDIVVDSLVRLDEIETRLASLGYEWRGNLGVDGREAFAATHDLGLCRHHLYLVADESRPYLDHVLLRDLLREDREASRRYGSLKRELARTCANVEVYTARKASLIAELLGRARRERGLPDVAYWEPSHDELGA